MKTIHLAVLAALILGAASGLQAARASKSSGSSGGASTSSKAGEPMRMGAGAAYIPARSAYLNALTFDLWVMEDLAVEALVGVGSGSVYNGGTDAGGKPAPDSVFNFGIGGGGRYALARPNDNLLVQAVARLSFENSSTSSVSRGSTTNTNSSIIGLYAGAGFEAFFPSWPDVSLEMNAGINALLGTTTVTPPIGASTTYGESAFYVGGGNGFLPLNLAFHYYF